VPVSSGEVFSCGPAEEVQGAFISLALGKRLCTSVLFKCQIGGDRAPPEGQDRPPTNYTGEAQDYIWSIASGKILSSK